jgi:hypothetical protein
MSVIHQPSYFLLFPRLQMKLKDRHSVTSEVIETESQAMLYTLTEYQKALKQRKRWER